MICYHEPLQDFEGSVGYDLIVSNPPYFESGPTKTDEGVANARHALTLILIHSFSTLQDC